MTPEQGGALRPLAARRPAGPPRRARALAGSIPVHAGQKRRPPAAGALSILWWSGGESNPRHADFQSAALPTELPDHRSVTNDSPITISKRLGRSSAKTRIPVHLQALLFTRRTSMTLQSAWRRMRRIFNRSIPSPDTAWSGRPFYNGRGIRAREKPPWSNILMELEHLPTPIYEGDIEGKSHETCVNCMAAGKREHERPAVTHAFGANREPEKPWKERVLYLQINSPPPKAIQGSQERLPSCQRFQIPHTTTPERQGSMVTARSCVSRSGEPRSTPAMVSAVGHGT